jgi:drug/metabolite transporter (DMT)-like permease
MNFRILTQLVLLGMIWGSSFMFQRITVPVIGVMPTAAGRLALSAIVLVAALAMMGRRLEWRAHWRDYFMIGLISAALPFAFFAFAAKSLPAGYSAVLNATVPLFTVLIVWVAGTRPSLSKLVGVVVGILGVVTLARFGALEPTWMTTAAFAACLAASVLYAFNARTLSARFKTADPLVVAAGSQLGAALALAPFGLYALPAQMPALGPLAALLALGVICTGLAYALFFRLIREAGSERAVTVTFMVPVFAQLWGALFIGEAITWASAIGCVLVLFAVALIFERVPGLRPRPVVASLPVLCADGRR